MKLAFDDWECDLKTSKIDITHQGTKQGSYYLLREPYCGRCSSNGKETEECGWHYKFHPSLHRVYAVGIYFEDGKSKISDDILSSHIWWLKFKSEEWAKPLGAAMALVAKALHEELLGYDLLVPVPPYKDSSSTKKYDHAEELTKVVSSILKIRWKQMLLKTRSERMVDKPTMDHRWEASKDLYQLSTASGETAGKKVLLIDDVCTSGSTISSSAGVLSEYGKASKVAALVAGRTYDTGYPVQ
jgi:predicted amidophosphoribosyltransferase